MDGNSKEELSTSHDTEITHYRDNTGLEVDDPSKLLVVTAKGYAYEHPDGVTVAPVGALGP